MNYAVIMAGGSGQRLWPLSREKSPKQIIKIINGKSLLEICIDRIKEIFPLDNIVIVTNQEYAGLIADHLPGLPPENILGEPVGRDTSNAIALAAGFIAKKAPDSAMAVFSADQVIEPVANLAAGLKTGFDFLTANPDSLLALGIKASSPHTGYGYLKKGSAAGNGVFSVDKFVEKPDLATAQQYLASGQYSWNSGMFIWKTATILAELQRLLPDNYAIMQDIYAAMGTDRFAGVLAEQFPLLRKISIDFGVMEKAAKVCMVELNCSWKDVGSFESLAETVGTVDNIGNQLGAATDWVSHNSGKNIIISSEPGHLIAGIDIDDLVIVHTPEATLICRKGQTGKIKELLAKVGINYK